MRLQHNRIGGVYSMKILIRNGTIHNGIKFIGVSDILIEDERITVIGAPEGTAADHVVDASGSIVAPGFIDVQNMHDELETLDRNEAMNLTSQGITSCVVGNCGRSGILSSRDSLVRQIDQLRQLSLGINVGLLVGHNSLRKFVLTDGERVATRAELARMVSMLDEALEHGALGMSSGLMYSPGLFADDYELTSLVSALGKRNKVYATHMRDEGDQLVEAVTEALDTAQEGQGRLVIAHFKVTGKDNWGKSDEAIRLIERRRDSQEIYIDFYPYTATSTVLSIMILPEVLERVGGHLERLLFALGDERLMETKGKQNLCLNGWNDIVIVASKVPGVVGESVASLARGGSCYRTVVEILRQDPGTRVVFHNIASEEELYSVAKLPYAMVVTDGYLYPAGSTAATHPRNYGAVSRVLSRYVLDEGLYSLEEFIRKASYLPATVYNMNQRGLIKEGYYADMVIFRPEEVQDRADYENPYSLSTGMQVVLVNGRLVLEGNRPAGVFPGRLIS